MRSVPWSFTSVPLFSVIAPLPNEPFGTPGLPATMVPPPEIGGAAGIGVCAGQRECSGGIEGDRTAPLAAS